VFDVLQFILLPLIAYLLFDIMRQISGKGDRVDGRTLACSVTLSFALLRPLSSYTVLTFWSWSYPRMYVEGEARVLQTALLILFLCLRRRNLRKFVSGSLVSLALVYVPTLLYANLGSQFYSTLFIDDFSIYSYERIPILTVASLTITIVALELMKERGTGPRDLRISNDPTAKADVRS
jgi:hypothetical protein